MNEEKNDFLARLFRRPIFIVLAIGIITVFFAFQLPKAELDNNNIRFIPENDEARQTSAYIDDTFGSSIFILVALERRFGDVFDAAFLNKIREFIERMEDFEIVGNVNSMVSSDYIFAEHGSILVQKLVGEDFTGTSAEIAVLKQRLLSWDIYRRSLISDDFRATQILIPLSISDEQASRPEIINSFIEIRDIAREMFRPYADVYVTGIPIISATINEAMQSDLLTMIPLVVLLVLFILFMSFRNFFPVLLPLISVLVATVWSMGAMPLVGIKLSVITTVLPVILVAVGSAYGIHVVTHYLEAAKGVGEISRKEHKVLVIFALRKIRKAVFLTAVTTMAGFLSFCFTPVLPIREFGFFASFGVLVSFLMAVTLIPSLIIIRGPRKIKTLSEKSCSAAAIDGGIVTFFCNIARRKAAVIFLSAFILFFSLLGMSKVVIDNVFVEYFKATTDISRSDRFIREKFGGSKIVSVVVRADTTEILLMPDVLAAMDKLTSYLEERVPDVGKVMGFTDLIKRINQVFNADESPDGLRPINVSFQDDAAFGFGDFDFWEFGFGSFFEDDTETGFAAEAGPAAVMEPETITAVNMVRLLREAAASGRDRNMDASALVRVMERLINYEGAAYYEIPQDPVRYGKTSPEELQQLVANYLILLSGNISSYANDPLSPTAIKTTVQLRTTGDEDTGRAIGRIQAYIDANFPKTVETIIGGTALVESSLNRLVVHSQLISIIISIIVIFLIVALVNRSLIAGIVCIAPLSICILINFAVMGFTGIKLNIGTSMMACLCLGIGIDYTIHYMEAYKREYMAAEGKGDFLPKTFAVSGKAIIINAVSVGSGFAVLLFSQFVMLQDLGLLIALAMGSSALLSLIVIPVLLSAIKPKFIHKELI
jgi:hypothetical protein